LKKKIIPSKPSQSLIFITIKEKKKHHSNLSYFRIHTLNKIDLLMRKHARNWRFIFQSCLQL